MSSLAQENASCGARSSGDKASDGASQQQLCRAAQDGRERHYSKERNVGTRANP